MSTNGVAAHSNLLSFEPLGSSSSCWHYVWKAYAAAGASTGMGSTPTAYKGWQATSGKHPGDYSPPYGAAIWLGRRYDGNMDGDVFIAGAWDGNHAATDEPTYYKTGTTSIGARMDLCGREYLGWTDHVLDCPIDMQNGSDEDMTTEEHNALMTLLAVITETTQWEGLDLRMTQTRDMVGTVKQVLMETEQWQGMDARLTDVQQQVARLEPLMELLEQRARK